MLSKRKTINTLFILSFPFFGIGNFISATSSPSIGYIVSVIFPLAIIVFYAIDLLYKKEFEAQLNYNYLFALLFLGSVILALYAAFSKGLPEMSFNVVIFKSLLTIIPLHAFIVVNLYNQEQEFQHLARHTFIGLSVLLFINLVGYYGLGLVNQVHHLEGRINFPFMAGLYEGSNMLAIITLMLLFYIIKHRSDPIITGLSIAYFLGALALIFFINSRLCIMILLLIFILYLSGAIRKAKTLFTLSVFTVPILLSSGLLIYQIMQLPPFISILQRVDLIDVVTFNGRAFLWQDAMDWIVFDRRGFFFGNGFSGQYFIDLVSDVAKLWNEENTYLMHLHSTSLEVMINQGMIFLVIFLILCYKTCKYFHIAYLNRMEEAPLFVVMIFMAFLLHVDTFLYPGSLGFFIWSVLLSKIVISDNKSEPEMETINTAQS